MHNVKTVFVACFLLISSFSFTQSINKGEEIKLQIEQFLEEENVIAINRIIKENSFLDVKYVLQVLTQNLTIAQKKSPKALAQTYLTLGNFWHIQDNKIKAYDYYLKCERISKELNDYDMLGVTLMNRSGMIEDNQSRLAMVKKAIQTFEKTDNLKNLIKAHLNTGIAYSKFVDDKKPYSTLSENEKRNITRYKKNAFKHYNIADSLNTAFLNSEEMSGAINVYFAEWYRFEENHEKAIAYFKKGKELFTNIGHVKGCVYTSIEIAFIENKTGKVQKAIERLKKAEEESKQYQFKDYLEDIYAEYVDIYTQQQNFKKALAYQQRLTEIKVEVTRLSNQDQLRILNLENELSENQHQLERYEIEKRRNQLLIAISVFVSLLMIVLIYFIVKNKKRKIESIEKSNRITKLKKTAIEIELKNKQLEEELLKEKVRFNQNHLIQFANQVDKIESFLSLLKTKIQELKKGNSKQQVFNDLKLSFSELINGQNHLKQLNSYTSQLNQDFFFYIDREYSNLSKDDQQLLAFIILNMDSKEIGRILNITTDSVFKKRYRLRKKLKLNKRTSFQDFYNTVTSNIRDD